MMEKFCRGVIVVVLLAGLVCGLARAEVEVVSVEKIWGGSDYCAFTDLVRFGGKWYCVFREADAHVYGRDGVIRVIVSDAGARRRSAALLAEDGVDLRDPKISVAAPTTNVTTTMRNFLDLSFAMKGIMPPD